MHWALVGDFHQPLTLLIVERALQCNGTVDVVEYADFGVTAFAISDMDLVVA